MFFFVKDFSNHALPMKKLTIIIVCLITLDLYGQGCSDAGFCTMGAMRPDQNYNKRIDFKVRSIEYNYYKGNSIISPVIRAHTIEFNASIGERNSIQVKVPYMIIKGNFNKEEPGNNHGLGDISLSFTRSLLTTRRGTLSGTLGTKIPADKADDKISNDFTNNQEVDLHMYYQTSLGSFDAIAGMSWITREWLFATGIQIALTENDNQFEWSDWANYPDQNYVERNNRGRSLKRGTDIMLRVERNFRFTNFNFSIGALPIYRITKDEAFVLATGQRQKLDNTLGLALSVLGSVGYNININNAIKFIYGYKLVDREVNPDGLTRDNVTSFSYIYRF